MALNPHLITGENKYRPAKIYTSNSFEVTRLDHDYTRADIEFHELDHSGASYAAHVYLNNPNANGQTPRTSEQGYAGRFDIFGHGGCYGDEGHCDVPTVRRAFDPRPSHPLEKIKKVVIATEAVRRAVAQGPNLTVTVVPLVTAATDECNIDEVFHCGSIRITTYR